MPEAKTKEIVERAFLRIEIGKEETEDIKSIEKTRRNLFLFLKAAFSNIRNGVEVRCVEKETKKGIRTITVHYWPRFKERVLSTVIQGFEKFKIKHDFGEKKE